MSDPLMRPLRPLGRRMLVHILIASTLITTLLVVGSLYLDFRTEMLGIEQTLTQIQQISGKTMAKLLWDVDEVTLRVQAASLLQNSDVVRVRITENDGLVSIDLKRDGYNPEYVFERSYPLVVDRDSERFQLGVLHIEATRENVYRHLLSKTLYLVVTQGLKTFAISLVILLLFRHLIARHLYRISSHMEMLARAHDAPAPTLTLNRSEKYRDELSLLVDSINGMVRALFHSRAQVVEALDEKERQLEVQRDKALSAARLASLGEVASGIAHEINNPLMIIASRASWIRMLTEVEPPQLGELRESARSIENTVRRISDIIEALRSLARQSGSDNAVACNLNDVVHDAHMLVQEKLRNGGIRCNVSYFPGAAMTLARPVELAQVMVNLLLNAAAAVAGGGNPWISVRVEADGSWVRAWVTDSGTGIPPAVSERMFEPFFTTKPVGQGTGLGLSISRSLMERMGGRLTYVENAPHTTFCLELPVMAPES